MKNYWARIYERSLQTVAAWQHGGPDFMVGELALAPHTAEVGLMDAQIMEMFQAESDLFTARLARDKSYKTITGLCTRACQVASGSLPAGHALRATVSEVRRQRRESQEAVLGKGRKLVTLWQAVNTYRAGVVPPLAPMLVGETDLGQFQDLLNAHPAFLQGVNDLKNTLVEKKGQLRKTADRLDRNNKRWFEAWKGHFPTGSPERASLKGIYTGPRQREPGRAAILRLEWLGSSFLWSYDAARGTSFTLLAQGPGESGFSVLAERVREKMVEYEPPSAAGEYRFKLIAHNSVGDGPESAVVVVKVELAEAAGT